MSGVWLLVSAFTLTLFGKRSGWRSTRNIDVVGGRDGVEVMKDEFILALVMVSMIGLGVLVQGVENPLSILAVFPLAFSTALCIPLTPLSIRPFTR